MRLCFLKRVKSLRTLLVLFFIAQPAKPFKSERPQYAGKNRHKKIPYRICCVAAEYRIKYGFQERFYCNKNTEPYLTIQAYLDAMVATKTIGYGKNYIADPALVIVPSWLPQQTQFRHLYAKSNGAYSYSYLVTDGENQYFLEIAAPATFPRTLRDLNLRVRAVKGEYEGMDKLENKRIYYFGNYEEITVTLTTVNGAAPTLEETDRILADFQLDRYTVQNNLVQLEYKS